MSDDRLSWRGGGCHCGGVRFEVALPPVVEAQTCNCSMCAKTGFVHVIVPESRFRIVKGFLEARCFRRQFRIAGQRLLQPNLTS